MNKRSRFLSSSNPFLTENNFSKSTEAPIDTFSLGQTSSEHMTISGAVNKSLLLGGILLTTGFLGAIILNPLLMWVGIFGGLIAVGVTYFRPKMAPITAPIYAALEGLALGTISGIFANALGAGVVINSVLLTMLALFTMLTLYRTGIIKPTEKFKSVVMTATGAIAVMYLVNLGLHMFGSGIPYLHDMSPIGIGISLVVIAVASLNLILDFDQFKRGEEMKAPVYMEWMAALGLMVTIVWLYIEILRLLAMFSSND